MTNILRSDEFGPDPVRFGERTGSLTIYDGLETPFSDDVIVLTDEHKTQIESFVCDAAREYGDKSGNKEPTYAQDVLGVPSVVVRVDATIGGGNIVPYEMEDSPSGQGITTLIQQAAGSKGVAAAITSQYERIAGELPMVVVSGARGHGTDDASVYGSENYLFDTELSADIPSDRLVIVKAIPGDALSKRPYLGLQDRALAPLVTEGEKSYLERLGRLKPVESETDLLYDVDGALRSQALKAREGSMAMGVTMYLDAEDRRRFGTRKVETATKLRRMAEEYRLNRGGALVQPFEAPLQFEGINGRTNAILRIFTLMEMIDGDIKATAIGGCYVARPELVVHGATNAVSGAVIMEDER